MPGQASYLQTKDNEKKKRRTDVYTHLLRAKVRKTLPLAMSCDGIPLPRHRRIVPGKSFSSKPSPHHHITTKLLYSYSYPRVYRGDILGYLIDRSPRDARRKTLLLRRRPGVTCTICQRPSPSPQAHLLLRPSQDSVISPQAKHLFEVRYYCHDTTLSYLHTRPSFPFTSTTAVNIHCTTPFSRTPIC